MFFGVLSGRVRGVCVGCTSRSSGAGAVHDQECIVGTKALKVLPDSWPFFDIVFFHVFDESYGPREWTDERVRFPRTEQIQLHNSSESLG